jgi:hypothetical protein
MRYELEVECWVVRLEAFRISTTCGCSSSTAAAGTRNRPAGHSTYATRPSSPISSGAGVVEVAGATEMWEPVERREREELAERDGAVRHELAKPP